MKKPAIKKIIDLKDKLDAYRASALAAGRGKGPARPGNLALASAAAGGAALAVTPAAEATIQYSGVRDIILTNTCSLINMDSVGPNEFQIVHNNNYGNYYAKIDPITASAGIVFTNLGGPLLKALSANYNITDTIAGPKYGWTAGYRYIGYTYLGPFEGQGNKYIGVRFTNGTGEHFGWIQVNLLAGSTSLAIIDWAYEDTPDTPILAGATGPQQAIPTLNEWGIIVLMTLLAGAAAWKMNRPEPLLQA